jgi:hypothetical protein
MYAIVVGVKIGYSNEPAETSYPLGIVLPTYHPPPPLPRHILINLEEVLVPVKDLEALSSTI